MYFVCYPHTQGIIEISLKPPKKPIYYTKKENFPTKNTKSIPTLQKRNSQVITPRSFFLSITLRFHILQSMLKALQLPPLLLRM